MGQKYFEMFLTQICTAVNMRWYSFTFLPFALNQTKFILNQNAKNTSKKILQSVFICATSVKNSILLDG